MAIFNPANIISDPDQLSATVKLTSETRASGDEVFIDTTTLTILLAVDGNLTADGVTLKCLYSFLKEEWKTNSDLIKFPFPMTPITDEQFEFYNGWNLDKTGSGSSYTPNLIRTGGWAVKHPTTGNDSERWLGVITLGTLGDTDQVYYQQVDLLTSDNTTNFVLTKTVNQAVQYYSDTNGDGTPDYNRNAFFKLFCREWEKTYASSNLGDIGVTSLNYQAYRFPLTNAADSKLVTLGASESAASGANVAVTAASWSANVVTLTANGHGFVAGDTVDVASVTPSGYNGTYTIVATPTTNTFTYALTSDPGSYTSGGNTSGDIFNNMNITWYTLGQSRTGFQSPTTAYFEVIIDADVSGTQSPNPTAEQIYAHVQSQLRKTTNINAGSVSESTGDKIGKVVPEKLRFVGDDLYTLGQTTGSEGVYIDDYNDTDVNRLHFWGYSANNGGTEYTNIQFPFTAVLTLNFGDNLVNDGDAIYRVFFTNDDSGNNIGRDYGTKDALIVNQKSGAPMANTISANSSIILQYDYDGNNQRGDAIANSAGTDVPITVVAIGLANAQYVKATGTIERSITNIVSLVAPLERNYQNPV